MYFKDFNTTFKMLQLNLYQTDQLFWYLSHHLTWHCSSIYKDLHKVQIWTQSMISNDGSIVKNINILNSENCSCIFFLSFRNHISFRYVVSLRLVKNVSHNCLFRDIKILLKKTLSFWMRLEEHHIQDHFLKQFRNWKYGLQIYDSVVWYDLVYIHKFF